jgi:8-oxo-dGTP pyrophosphatase MutT (NUDIX family)
MIVVKEKIVYQGKIIELIERHFERDGKSIVHERARRSPGVRTLVLSADNHVLLTREKRYELDAEDYRLPGGKVFDRLDDYNEFLATHPDSTDMLPKAKAAAVLELKEETGLDIREADLEFVYVSPCGSTVDWDLFYFMARVPDTKLGKQLLGEGENIIPEWHNVADAKALALDDSKMSEDRSVAFILRVLERILI